jgi:hypothetical protein
MENKEYQKVIKDFDKYCKKDRIGKIVYKELNSVLKQFYLAGYINGKLKKAEENKTEKRK